MSYEVLARRWRPQRFEDVVAQDHVTTTLRNAMKAQRIAHAYLFAGPRGIGKTTTARILAKALNCEQRDGVEPCNECSSCAEVVSSSNLDVLEIDGASNRGIDEIRNLRENVKYAPARGPYKIYIIDEVHMLTAEAFNALLKTLEEPPEHVVFVFATTQPHRVPPTILSRCQRFDFRKIPPDKIETRLRAMVEQEKMAVDSDVLPILAQKADGSLRDAESMLDQLVSFGGERVTVDDARSVLGLVDERLYAELMNHLLSQDARGALETVAEVDGRGYDLVEFVGGFLAHLRSMLLARLGIDPAGGESDAVGGSEAAIAAGRELLPEDIVRMMRVLSGLDGSMRRSSQPRILLETELVRLANLDSTVLVSDLLSRLARLEKRLGENRPGSGGSPGTPRGSGAPRKTRRAEESGSLEPDTRDTQQREKEAHTDRVVTLGRIEQVWERLIEQVKRRKISLGTFLAEGSPAELSNGSLVLAFYGNNEFHREQVDDRAHRQLIQEELAKLVGEPLKISCCVRSEEVTRSQDRNASGRSPSDSKQTPSESEQSPAQGSGRSADENGQSSDSEIGPADGDRSPSDKSRSPAEAAGSLDEGMGSSRGKRKAAVEQKMLDDPMVKHVIDLFDGRIVERGEEAR
jgi:DNA polymerase-3 subunit gamma/tau